MLFLSVYIMAEFILKFKKKIEEIMRHFKRWRKFWIMPHFLITVLDFSLFTWPLKPNWVPRFIYICRSTLLFQTFLTLINLYIGKFPNVCCIFYFEKHLNAARTIFMVSQNTFVSYEKLIKIHWKIMLKETWTFRIETSNSRK